MNSKEKLIFVFGMWVGYMITWFMFEVFPKCV